MSKQWFYMHKNKVFGPVPLATLRQLVGAKALLPTDLIWAESVDPNEAIQLHTVIDFASKPPSTGAKRRPDWQTELEQALRPSKPRPKVAVPDWLGDVEGADSSGWVGEAEGAESSEPVEAAPEAEPPSVELVAEFVPEESTAPVGVVLEPLALGRVQDSPYRAAIGAATSRGRVRDRNEDCGLIQQWRWSEGESWHEIALAVVADGMGGYQAGDVAAALTVFAVAGEVATFLRGTLSGSGPNAIAAGLSGTLDRAIREANKIVHARSQASAQQKGMGATVAAVAIWNGRAFIGHVGDARVWHLRGDRLTQLTRDQTLVMRMVDLGQLTIEQSATHPARNEVTQAVGKRATLDPVLYEQQLESGDMLIVACDGLSAHVDADTLLATASQPAKSAPELASELVRLADDNGGTDNCTVIVVRAG